MFRARRMMRRRAIARTAMVGGAREGDAQQPDQPQVQGPPEAAVDHLQQIKELAELREQGILTEEEFAAEKKRLLGS